MGRSYLMLVYCCSTWNLLDGSGTFVSNVGLLLFHLGLVGRRVVSGEVVAGTLVPGGTIPHAVLSPPQ